MIPNGTGNAIVTPFLPDGSVDHATLTALARWHVASGINFLVACGSTGEAQTLEPDERASVVRTVLAAVDGAIPVLAGVTDNSTRRAVVEAGALAPLGIAGVMSASPYYNKPTQTGLVEHFTRIADAIPVPLLLYNVPGRTGVDLGVAAVATLAEHSNIGGIKEASGQIRRIIDLIHAVPDAFTILCGDDDLAVPAIACGARGLISVAGNLLPEQIAAMVADALAGRLPAARRQQQKLLAIIDALFAEANPIPVKAALALRGFGTPTVRLPLVPATPALQEHLATLLQEYPLSHA